MTLTDYAAWWAAIIATGLLVWDIYKWVCTGPKIALKVRPDMRTMSHNELDGKRLFLFEVANKGDRPTTLTKLMFFYYQGIWRYIRRNAQYYYIKNPALQHNLPHKLEVGETWEGAALYSDEHDAMVKNGHLYAALFCSQRDRPVMRRVRPRK